MRFAKPLVPATLIRRHKRFLADIRLDDGTEATAHCPNPGSMMGLAEPGMRIWVEPNDDPRRTLRYAWRMVEMGPHWAGIDTGVPNKVVGEALSEGRIPALAAYAEARAEVRAEVRYGRNSRVDFLARAPGLPDAYIEVKNVHLMREAGLAEFPDSVTTRGAKHLDELAGMVAAGHRAIMLYVVQRDDCERLALAPDLDPGYAAAFGRAREAGVEAMVWRCRLSVEEIALDRPLAMAE